MNENTLEENLARCAMQALQRSDALRSLGRTSEARKYSEMVSTLEALWHICDEATPK